VRATGGPPAIRAAVTTRARRVLAEYVRFQYTEGALKLYGHITQLPRPEASAAWLGVAAAALAVIATPLLAGAAGGLPGIAFEDTSGAMRSAPVPAVVLALAVFSLAWGYLLAGAAQGPGLLWIVTGLLFVYMLVGIGLAVGRSYLHLLALALPVAVGAISRGGRRWAQVGLVLLVSTVMVRLVPLPPAWRARWYLLWPAAVALALGLHALLARRPWAAPGWRVLLGGCASALYLAVTVLVSSPRAVAGGFDVSLNNTITILEMLWFLLGAAFIAGAVAFGRFAHRVVGLMVSDPIPAWVLIIGWAALVAWAFRGPLVGGPAIAQAASAAVLLAAAAALALRWRQKGLARQWLAGWFVGSIAVLGAVQAYLSLDVSDVLRREAGTLSLIAFAYAVTWEVAGRIPDVPLAARGFGRPSPLLLYLGVILLVSAATLFGLSADLKFFQQVVTLSQYKGAASLWIPVGLVTVLGAWPAFPVSARPRVLQAFLWGALLAVPCFVLRAALGPGPSDLIALSAAAGLGLLLVSRWREARGAIPAAAIAAAAALGLAVSMAQRLLVALLHPLLTMIAALGGPRVFQRAGNAAFDMVHGTGWRSADQLTYYVLGPAAAIGVAVLAARVRQAADRRAPEASSPR
jgi:hypothetical protein